MSLFSRFTRRNDRRRKYQPYRYQPRLELLEGRALPSILMVTNNSDTGVSGDGSLRGEIAAAASGDTIEFAGNLQGQTITLSKGELALSKNLGHRRRCRQPHRHQRQQCQPSLRHQFGYRDALWPDDHPGL